MQSIVVPSGEKTLQHASISYRPDVEGLRGMAILLVVAAHAGVPGLQGGFIGVDVFFVLSGYLITGLLYQEVSANLHISLLDFYLKRFRRLYPALFCMLLGVGAVASVLYAPTEQIQQSSAASAATAWVSNLHFAFSEFDYFGPNSDSNLFLHTWSLGVEEQFYLLWPILMMFFIGTWSDKEKSLNLNRLWWGLVVLFLLGILLSLFLSVTKPLWGFYLAPSRSWQFAVGALCFLLPIRQASNSGRRRTDVLGSRDLNTDSVFAYVGAGLILGSALSFDKNITYPGLWAVLPSFGTGLLLLAGTKKTKKNGVSSVLSTAPMQALGRLSYSWYLWHWPVLVMGGTLFLSDHQNTNIFLVLLSLALAYLSYRLVESPFRRANIILKYKVASIVSFILCMALTVLLSLHWNHKIESWNQQPTQMEFQRIRAELPAIYSSGCDTWYFTDEVRLCLFGNENAKKTLVLIGDSIAGQWFPAISSAVIKMNWRLVVITKSACPMVDESVFYQRIGQKYTVCDSWRNRALETIIELKPDVVILGSGQRTDLSGEQWRDGTDRILSRITTAAQQVFLLRPTHRLPADALMCLERKQWQPSIISSKYECEYLVEDKLNKSIFGHLKTAASGYDNVEVVDLTEVICQNSVCPSMSNGKVVYRDHQHLSKAYALTMDGHFVQLLNSMADAYENVK